MCGSVWCVALRYVCARCVRAGVLLKARALEADLEDDEKTKRFRVITGNPHLAVERTSISNYVTWVVRAPYVLYGVKYIDLVSLTLQWNARTPQILTQRPFFSKWRKIWIRDVFWSQHLGCWGRNTSGIQNKGDYATLCLRNQRNKALQLPCHTFNIEGHCSPPCVLFHTKSR